MLSRFWKTVESQKRLVEILFLSDPSYPFSYSFKYIRHIDSQDSLQSGSRVCAEWEITKFLNKTCEFLK
jgi:hypothetical protein